MGTSGPTFEGAKLLYKLLEEHCHPTRPMIAGYVGISDDNTEKDQKNTRNGEPLWKVLPYDSIDRMYLAFATSKDCEVLPGTPYVKDMVNHARRINPNLEGIPDILLGL